MHGSTGNLSLDHRRLAASIRYMGDDVRWRTKKTDASPATKTVSPAATRANNGKGYSYRSAVAACYAEMQDGEVLGLRECSDVAFPVVWRASAQGDKAPAARL